MVTSGAIASPQLLMCSGIGPAHHLRERGISVVYDNPNVGENLQDHPAAVVSFRTPKKGVSVTSKLRLFGKTNPFPVLEWLFLKKGLLTSTGCDHGAFVRTSSSTGQPDLQIRFLAARAVGPDGMTTFTQFRNAKNHVSLPTDLYGKRKVVLGTSLTVHFDFEFRRMAILFKAWLAVQRVRVASDWLLLTLT